MTDHDIGIRRSRPSTAQSRLSSSAFDPMTSLGSGSGMNAMQRLAPTWSEASLPAWPTRLGPSRDTNRPAQWPPAPLAQQDEPGEDEFGLVGHNSKWVKPMGTTVEIGRVDPITRAMHPGGPLHGGRGAEIVQTFEHHGATPPPPYDNGFLPKHAMLPTETEVSACVGPPYHFILFSWFVCSCS